MVSPRPTPLPPVTPSSGTATPRHELLRQLSTQIRAIELGSELSASAEHPASTIDIGWPHTSQLFRRGSVHDLFATLTPPAPHHTSHDAAGPSSPRASRTDDAPPLLVLTHLASRSLLTAPQRLVLWIGQRIWPSVHALIDRDDPHRALLTASVLIDPPDDASRLWAIDLALRSPGVAAVIADARGLDLAATRRLQLAGASGATAIGLLVRSHRDAGELSAASARWRIAPVPVPRSDAPPQRTPNGFGRFRIPPITWRPRLAVTLEHCKGMQFSFLPPTAGLPVHDAGHTPDIVLAGCQSPTWIVEQSRGPLCVCVSSPLVAGCAAPTAPQQGVVPTPPTPPSPPSPPSPASSSSLTPDGKPYRSFAASA